MATNPATALNDEAPRLALVELPLPQRQPLAPDGPAPTTTPDGNGQPANARERVASLASQAGLRLNHRAAWVLKIIGNERALSNQEIADRAGGLAKGHASTLLARLARAGLIENTRDHATSPIANAWRLTADGRELERAIRAGMPRLGEPRRRRRRDDPSGRNMRGAATPPSAEEHDRARLVSAALRAWDTDGEDRLSAEAVAQAARVSRDAFDRHFADVEACLAAALDHAAGQARLAVSGACVDQDGWLDRTRAGLRALLEFFDAQPAAARALVNHSACSAGVIARRRAALLAEAAAAIDDEHAPTRGYPPALTAEALIAGALGVLQGRLNERRQAPLVDLAPALMSFLAMPYLGRNAARRELARAPMGAPPSHKAALEMLQGVSGRAVRDRRALLALGAVADEPGISNAQVAQRAEIKDQGQASRILSRLARLGLIENTLDGEGLALASNAWQLTRSGELLYGSVAKRGGTAPEAATAPTNAVYRTAACFSRSRSPARLVRLRAKTHADPHFARRAASHLLLLRWPHRRDLLEPAPVRPRVRGDSINLSEHLISSLPCVSAVEQKPLR